jgi:choline dehydrogenase-like flavoprotein
MIRGKGLGGGSQINFQVWSLGAKDEFDAWAKTVDAPEWGFESIVANVKKVFSFIKCSDWKLNF